MSVLPYCFFLDTLYHISILQTGLPLVFSRAPPGSPKAPDQGVRVWGANTAGGLCRENTPGGLLAREDLSTGCKVRLTEEQVRWWGQGGQVQCEQVRACGEVEREVRRVVASLTGGLGSLVARGGAPNYSVEGDWVSVLFLNSSSEEREEREKREGGWERGGRGNPLPSCRVPSLVRVTVLYTDHR